MSIERLNIDLQDDVRNYRGSDFTDDEEKAEQLDTIFSQVYELCEEVKPFIEGR